MKLGKTVYILSLLFAFSWYLYVLCHAPERICNPHQKRLLKPCLSIHDVYVEVLAPQDVS
jgi:hypothetical protein